MLHFFAIEAGTGQVYSWGANFEHQLGRSTGGSFESLQPAPVVLESGLPLTGVVAVSGGDDFGVARMSDATLRTWGRKALLGRPDSTGNSESWDHPGPVLDSGSQPLGEIIQVAAGAEHTVASSANGQVWSFGSNEYSQLGQTGAGLGVVITPGRVRRQESNFPVLGNIVQIAAGAAHSIALDASGAVWTWGANDKGQLGDGSTTQRLSPVKVKTASPHLVFTAYRLSPMASPDSRRGRHPPCGREQFAWATRSGLRSVAGKRLWVG